MSQQVVQCWHVGPCDVTNEQVVQLFTLAMSNLCIRKDIFVRIEGEPGLSPGNRNIKQQLMKKMRDESHGLGSRVGLEDYE